VEAQEGAERDEEADPEGQRDAVGRVLELQQDGGEAAQPEVDPELSVDVTATTVVLGAMASRDWRRTASRRRSYTLSRRSAS